ncbi:MAG: P-II family nitrogen regulator [Clostridia bacterium]|nr:P-II family nitrogen regulator [Clostridia bacterium]
MKKTSVIFCIVNNGFSEAAMDCAKKYGATGGTVFHARGTASKEAEKHFNITIEPDKEILMIILDEAKKNDVLYGLYDEMGTGSSAQGVAFTLPVEDVIGIESCK